MTAKFSNMVEAAYQQKTDSDWEDNKLSNDTRFNTNGRSVCIRCFHTKTNRY